MIAGLGVEIYTEQLGWLFNGMGNAHTRTENKFDDDDNDSVAGGDDDDDVGMMMMVMKNLKG